MIDPRLRFPTGLTRCTWTGSSRWWIAWTSSLRSCVRGDSTSLEVARRVLEIEAQAIRDLQERLDGRFERAVELLLGCRGRVVVTGMGESGLFGRKVAATLSSTGTPAMFLH